MLLRIYILHGLSSTVSPVAIPWLCIFCCVFQGVFWGLCSLLCDLGLKSLSLISVLNEPHRYNKWNLRPYSKSYCPLIWTFGWSLNPWVVWACLSWTLVLTISVCEHLHSPQTVRTGLPGTQQSELKSRWKARIYIGRTDRYLVRHEWVPASFWMESSSRLQYVHWWSKHAQRFSPFLWSRTAKFPALSGPNKIKPTSTGCWRCTKT